MSVMPAVKEEMAGHGQSEQWEVADIFRLYGEDYRSRHPLPPSHLRVMHAIEVCRTPYLGGHVQKCDSCGYEHYLYHSCRNRHCPKCQSLAKAKWLEDRKTELLPVSYFHTVFTVPHILNPLALCNKKIIFDILFKSVSETLLTFGKNPDNGLGGKLGFIAVLHTWAQTLLDHFHLHCLIPAGALSFDGTQWIAARDTYLFNVQALSLVFRGKFVHSLKKAYHKGRLIFPGETAYLENKAEFASFVDSLYKDKWVVYSKKPFAGPEQVLNYLGRYTHRVAISNNRIKDIKEGKVTFTYRDRKDGDTLKEMTVTADEFIRRFLLHVLPDSFMKIRYFGFLANRYKKDNIECIRRLCGLSPELPEKVKKSVEQLMEELTGNDITQCPLCKKGTLKYHKALPKAEEIVNSYREPYVFDSS